MEPVTPFARGFRKKKELADALRAFADKLEQED